MKILIVEDDIQLNTTISNYLLLKEYEVKSVFDGKKALSLIDDNFDMFIIDINIPEVNGIELLKEIRKISNAPVIMITASLELDNFQDSFKYGCSEYIKKPFYLEELEIRINKLINDVNQVVNIEDNIKYDMKYEELKIDGELIDLTKKEKKLLTILLRNLNHIVPNEEIQKFVWEEEKENYPLRQLVNNLRKKLPKNYIVSKKAIGYKFEVNP